MTDLELIAYAEQHAQQDALLPHEHIIQLLSIEPGSAARRPVKNRRDKYRRVKYE